MILVAISKETVFSVMWVLAILFVAILILIRISRIKKVKKIISRFQSGNMDASLIDKCEKLRGDYLRAGQLGTHDVFCYMLCSFYADEGNEERMIAYLNAFRTDTPENERRIHRILIQFFSERKSEDLLAALREKKDGKNDETAAIEELINESVSVDDTFEMKLQMLREQLKRDAAINALDTFVTMAKEENRENPTR